MRKLKIKGYYRKAKESTSSGSQDNYIRDVDPDEEEREFKRENKKNNEVVDDD